MLRDEIPRKTGAAMRLATRDLRAASRIRDHVAVTQRGRLAKFGPAAARFGAPWNDWVRSLFAAVPAARMDYRRVSQRLAPEAATRNWLGPGGTCRPAALDMSSASSEARLPRSACLRIRASSSMRCAR